MYIRVYGAVHVVLASVSGDDLDLPHVSRHCITLTKFLGSGAFGEVFEGTACELPCLPDVNKVAVKVCMKDCVFIRV